MGAECQGDVTMPVKNSKTAKTPTRRNIIRHLLSDSLRLLQCELDAGVTALVTCKHPIIVTRVLEIVYLPA
jgi:hypothetical protein